MYNSYNFISDKANRQHAAQLALAYAIQRSIRELFYDADTGSDCMEERCYLHYRALPKKRRDALDEKAERVVERAAGKYADVLSGMRARIVMHAAGDVVIIEAITGFETVVCVVALDGEARGAVK